MSKIIKHAKEAPGSSAHGLLLGLDLDGTLEVSNSFPLPHHSNDEDDKSLKSVGECSLLVAAMSDLLINELAISTVPGCDAPLVKGGSGGR